MELRDYLEGFAADWRLAGRATTIADIYGSYLKQLDEKTGSEILPTALYAAKWTSWIMPYSFQAAATGP